MEVENKSIVKISNVLNLTRQEFTVVEKHIFHLVLNEIKANQGFHLQNIDTLEPIIVKISSGDILKSSKNITALKESLKKIVSRSLFFDFSKADNEYFGSIVPFPYACYEGKKGSKGYIQIDINYKCKKLFLELANGYTNLQLDAILNLKSEYSIRMYELLSMYKNQGIWTVKVDDLRVLLNLNPSNYKIYTQLENRILKYSQKELFEHCGLHFDWEIAEKERKKVTALTFNIRTKEQLEKIVLNQEIKQTIDFINQLNPKEISEKYHLISTLYQLTPIQIDYIVSNRDVFNEFIRLDIIIEDMIAKGKPPRNRTAYLAKSLGLDKIKFKK
jgi:plasmid replication initiation protein